MGLPVCSVQGGLAEDLPVRPHSWQFYPWRGEASEDLKLRQDDQLRKEQPLANCRQMDAYLHQTQTLQGSISTEKKVAWFLPSSLSSLNHSCCHLSSRETRPAVPVLFITNLGRGFFWRRFFRDVSASPPFQITNLCSLSPGFQTQMSMRTRHTISECKRSELDSGEW